MHRGRRDQQIYTRSLRLSVLTLHHINETTVSAIVLYAIEFKVSAMLYSNTIVFSFTLHYSDHIKSVLRKCNIPEAQLEALAEDMFLWSLTCATGLKNLAAAAAEQAASDLRARRHAAATATPAGPVCPYCGRICASDFGLRSHLRVHL